MDLRLGIKHFKENKTKEFVIKKETTIELEDKNLILESGDKIVIDERMNPKDTL